jgi:hypothetical protein
MARPKPIPRHSTIKVDKATINLSYIIEALRIAGFAESAVQDFISEARSGENAAAVHQTCLRWMAAR